MRVRGTRVGHHPPEAVGGWHDSRDFLRRSRVVGCTSTGTPPYFRPASWSHRVGHVGGPAIREYDDVAGQLSKGMMA
ncbi:hypothetical protein B296_00030138 [Ensete ventricosum]|uniref:Uncharacterized protein n=1 Tax=Ensete ventricosum TaxID=4639 RepID=A0A426YTW4_ENSVE|nr:hypothetical protein B296_00030138 [Ensete ventricosum]